MHIWKESPGQTMLFLPDFLLGPWGPLLSYLPQECPVGHPEYAELPLIVYPKPQRELQAACIVVNISAGKRLVFEPSFVAMNVSQAADRSCF